jgi:hypothetical protein
MQYDMGLLPTHPFHLDDYIWRDYLMNAILYFV